MFAHISCLGKGFENEKLHKINIKLNGKRVEGKESASEALKIKLQSCHKSYSLNAHLFSSKKSTSERNKKEAYTFVVPGISGVKGTCALCLQIKQSEGTINATYERSPINRNKLKYAALHIHH